jgi:hypothetical protein
MEVLSMTSCDCDTKQYSQSNQCECEQCLVDSAHHDSNIFIPMPNVALVRQCAGHIPGQ